MYLRALLIESIRSGTIASLVIVPLSPIFKAAGLRIGHYGPKFAALLFESTEPWVLFLQHLVIGCLSAFPLLFFLANVIHGRRPVFVGGLYGAAYYVVVNSLVLPIYFGDLLPWQMGFGTVWPSLIGHIIYGASIGFSAKHFRFLPSR